MASSWMRGERRRWSSTRRTSILSEVREGGRERRRPGGKEGNRREVQGSEAYARTHAGSLLLLNDSAPSLCQRRRLSRPLPEGTPPSSLPPFLPPSVHIKPLIHASPLLIHLTDPSFYLLHSLPLSLQSIDDPAAFWAEIAHEFHWETPWEETGKEGGREGRRGRWDGMSRAGT